MQYLPIISEVEGRFVMDQNFNASLTDRNSEQFQELADAVCSQVVDYGQSAKVSTFD